MLDLLAVHAVVRVGGLDRGVAVAARLDRYLEQLVLADLLVEGDPPLAREVERDRALVRLGLGLGLA